MRAAVGLVCVLSLVSGGAAERWGYDNQEPASVTLESPDGRVALAIAGTDGRLSFRITRAGQTAIEPSPLGIVVDGANLGEGAAVGRIER
jgi:hypothetical protein